MKPLLFLLFLTLIPASGWATKYDEDSWKAGYEKGLETARMDNFNQRFLYYWIGFKDGVHETKTGEFTEPIYMKEAKAIKEKE